jgi:ABC-2 type transport system permease protein
MSSLAAVVAARSTVEIKQYFRQRESLIFNFLFPIILLVIFASAFGDAEIPVGPGESITFAHYFLPGIVAVAVFLSSFQTLAIEIAIERDNGVLKRLRGTPMPATAYFLGKIVQVVVTTVVQIALLLVVAALMYDVPLPDDPATWGRFAWLVLLGSAGGTALGIAFSSVPPNARQSTVMITLPVILLSFISGVYFQWDALPGWMQRIASVFPLKWIAQGMRSVFLPDNPAVFETTDSWQTPETAIILGAWLVVGLVLARLTFRWLPKGDG